MGLMRGLQGNSSSDCEKATLVHQAPAWKRVGQAEQGTSALPNPQWTQKQIYHGQMVALLTCMSTFQGCGKGLSNGHT